MVSSRLGVALAVGAIVTLTGARTASATDKPPVTWVHADSGNYDTSSHAKTMIVIHKAEGTASGAASWFANPAASASAQYSVGDDTVYQMVDEAYTAWHAGNYSYNQKAIGIENGGYTYRDDMTEAHYKLLAQLVANICERHGIPEDRTHIIGHSEVPDPYHPGEFGGAAHHTDPGPYFDWDHFMALVHAYSGGTSTGSSGSSGSSSSGSTSSSSGLHGVSVSVDTLNVRTAAWGTIIAQVRSGDGFVRTGAESSGFVEIYFRGGKGWIYKSYTSPHSWWSAKVTVADLNVRTGAWGTIVGHVHSGEVYVQIAATTDWREIQYDQEKRWVYRSYCTGLSVGS